MKPKNCEAKRERDEMACARCGTRWDVREEAPECSKVALGNEVLSTLRESVQNVVASWIAALPELPDMAQGRMWATGIAVGLYRYDWPHQHLRGFVMVSQRDTLLVQHRHYTFMHENGQVSFEVIARHDYDGYRSEIRNWSGGKPCLWRG